MPTSGERKAARPPKRVIGGAIHEADRARCGDEPDAQLLKGIEELNAGRFFEQHETLEILWRDTRTPIRGLFQGILQIGVGFHHWSKGNHHGAETLLSEGIDRLRPFAPVCQTIDVAALIADAGAARDLLLSLGPGRMSEYDLATAPQVRRVAAGSAG